MFQLEPIEEFQTRDGHYLNNVSNKRDFILIYHQIKITQSYFYFK